MVSNSNNKIIIQENDNLICKREKSLIIDCDKCSEINKNFYLNEKCIYCFVNSLLLKKIDKIDSVLISKNNLLIEKEQIKIFIEFFKKVKEVKTINEKLNIIRKKKCIYKEFKCKLFPTYFSRIKSNKFEIYDPIQIYKKHITRIEYLKVNDNLDSYCRECFEYLNRLEHKISRILKTLSIIKKYEDFQKRRDLLNYFSSFYEYFFNEGRFLLNTKKNSMHSDFLINKELINVYKTGEEDLFEVSIYSVIDENENIYQVNYAFKSKQEKDYISKIVQEALNELNLIEFDQILPLETLIKIYQNKLLIILNSKYRFSTKNSKKIAFISTLKRLQLEKLFPLLIDDYIEEIFIDSPYDEIYLNHQKYGRCRTCIKFSQEEIERIKTFVRLYSGKRLDFINPTIKLVLKNKYFFCRFSLDIEPIQAQNFALDIRKLNRNILNIQDLLKNKTLSPLLAAFLYFLIIWRRNITVTGETNSGKTTFINALDLLTPKEFRKIYIEDIMESLNQSDVGKHQLNYLVDSHEDSATLKYSKSNQIKTLLHRTPDIIYLGEILTKEEAEAMFHCLAAGLRGFQTIHSNNIDSLINRFIFHFKIDRSCLGDLGILILMKKHINGRRVVSISEITKLKKVRSIFEYNSELKKWNSITPLIKTKIIKDLLIYEGLAQEKFSFFIEIYNIIFNYLAKIDKINNLELVDLFHKISYYSLKSIEALKSYWEKWKKSRSLN